MRLSHSNIFKNTLKNSTNFYKLIQYNFEATAYKFYVKNWITKKTNWWFLLQIFIKRHKWKLEMNEHDIIIRNEKNIIINFKLKLEI